MLSINGQIVDPKKAKISVSDNGLTRGLAVFESFRVSGHKAFLIDEHFDRLAKNLKALNIKWDDDRIKYYRWIAEITKNITPDKDAFVRFLVTGGDGDIEISHQLLSLPTVVIYSYAIEKYKPVSKKAATLTSVKRLLPEYFDSVGFRLKLIDYSTARIAKTELGNKNDEGILLSPEGYVAEAITSNIFWVEGQNIYTPPLALGILPGITRDYLIKNYDIKEKLIKPEGLVGTDEIFLTSGVNYLRAISRVNEQKKPGIDGIVFKKIFKKLIEDIKNQSINLRA